MNELRALVCQKCGASLNPRTLRCEYCGTYHERTGDNIAVKEIQFYTEQPKIKVIKSAMEISDYVFSTHGLNDDDLGRIIREGLTSGLAKVIPEYMDVSVERDFIGQSRYVTGRLRVLEPEYRF